MNIPVYECRSESLLFKRVINRAIMIQAELEAFLLRHSRKKLTGPMIKRIMEKGDGITFTAKQALYFGLCDEIR